MPSLHLPIALSVVLASASPLAAQTLDSASLAANVAAVKRIATVRLTPPRLRLAAGDTLKYTIEFLDSSGVPVRVRKGDGTVGLPLYYLTPPGLSFQVAASRKGPTRPGN